MGEATEGGFDPAGRYGLDPDVALRPEPFGALAYHYGSRRLTFLRSSLLAELVRDLDRYPSIDAARRPKSRRNESDLPTGGRWRRWPTRGSSVPVGSPGGPGWWTSSRAGWTPRSA